VIFRLGLLELQVFAWHHKCQGSIIFCQMMGLGHKMFVFGGWKTNRGYRK